MPLIDRLRKEFAFIKGNYAILVISWILIDFAMELPATYYALYVLELGATETILGMIGLFSFLALASMQFPGGYLADKFGRKWLISSMTFGVALSFILYAIAPSWHFILLGAVLMSLFNSTYQPALMAMIADSVPSERRGMGFGIIMLITSASTTPGPFVAGILYIQFGLALGMRISYCIVVVLFLIAATLRLLRLKETVTNAQKPSLSELLQSYPTALKESFGVWKTLPRSMFYLFLSGVVTTLGFAAVQLYFVVYAVKELLIDEAVWPFILTALFITMIVLAVPIGKIIDKFNRKLPLLAAYVIFGISMWFFVNGDLLRLFVSLVLVGVGQVMMNSAFGALQADLTPKEQRGKVNGFTNFVNFVFMAFGSLLGGFLYEHVSPQLPFFLAMVSIVPSFILTLALVHEPEKKEE
ncbi:MAG: MFS transporter [Candidatus Bathyarchaeota archaeon]|nr:MFS transporter [Candidatus Bathyarchaeota archaeon]MDH5494313.1 MFS transporter [Candidatus Bathyarchaeota archaeon]